jgi:hypothetical protein
MVKVNSNEALLTLSLTQERGKGKEFFHLVKACFYQVL